LPDCLNTFIPIYQLVVTVVTLQLVYARCALVRTAGLRCPVVTGSGALLDVGWLVYYIPGLPLRLALFTFSSYARLRVPGCLRCAGYLKPHDLRLPHGWLVGLLVDCYS